MELKKVSSAGDPELVKRNRQTINPLIPSIAAVAAQSIATIYLYELGMSISSIVSSGLLTLVYAMVGYLLVKEPKNKEKV